MIETKTTRDIIVDEIGENINALEFTKCVDEAPSLQKVWVGLDELKKDLTEIRHTLNQGKLQKAKVLVNNLDSELDLCLCNSQEQKGDENK